MLDTTTDAGGRADRRLREEKIAWLTTYAQTASRSRCPSGSCGTARAS